MTDERAQVFAAAIRDTTSLQPWYRRRAGLVALVVAAVLAITVLTDLPVPDNRASDIAAARSVIGQTNSDLAACTNAASEAFQLLGLRYAGTITDYERANAGPWIEQDIVACSLANTQVFDLSNITVPGTSSGSRLGDMLGSATTWATSDALDAMNAIARLMNDPTNADARAALLTQWRLMVTHRAEAIRSAHEAAAMLATSLPSLSLPQIPRPVAAPSRG